MDTALINTALLGGAFLVGHVIQPLIQKHLHRSEALDDLAQNRYSFVKHDQQQDLYNRVAALEKALTPKTGPNPNPTGQSSSI